MHCEKTMFEAKQKPLVLRFFFPRTFFLVLAAICHEMNFPEKKMVSNTKATRLATSNDDVK